MSISGNILGTCGHSQGTTHEMFPAVSQQPDDAPASGGINNMSQGVCCDLGAEGLLSPRPKSLQLSSLPSSRIDPSPSWGRESVNS